MPQDRSPMAAMCGKSSPSPSLHREAESTRPGGQPGKDPQSRLRSNFVTIQVGDKPSPLSGMSLGVGQGGRFLFNSSCASRVPSLQCHPTQRARLTYRREPATCSQLLQPHENCFLATAPASRQQERQLGYRHGAGLGRQSKDWVPGAAWLGFCPPDTLTGSGQTASPGNEDCDTPGFCSPPGCPAGPPVGCSRAPICSWPLGAWCQLWHLPRGWHLQLGPTPKCSSLGGRMGGPLLHVLG